MISEGLKSKIFLGEACPQTPLAARFVRYCKADKNNSSTPGPPSVEAGSTPATPPHQIPAHTPGYDHVPTMYAITDCRETYLQLI